MPGRGRVLTVFATIGAVAVGSAVGACLLSVVVYLRRLLNGEEPDDVAGGVAMGASGEWDATWADHVDCRGDVPEAVWDEMMRLRGASDPKVGVRHVILVRHAQGVGGADAKGDKPLNGSGSPRTPSSSALSDLGQKQAAMTAKRLREIFDDVDAIYHSGSPESEATARAFYAAFSSDPKSTPRLEKTGLLEEAVPILPSPSPDALKEYAQAETLQAHAARAECAFHALVWPPRSDAKHRELMSVEIAVAPGNLMRFLTCRAVQLPPRAWSRMAASHCTVTWLEIRRDGDVVLREFGGSGHLPPELLTYY